MRGRHAERDALAIQRVERYTVSACRAQFSLRQCADARPRNEVIDALIRRRVDQ
jgi:hypothetical protein